MSNYRLILDWDKEFYKGDSITLPIEVRNTDISSWKIRVRLYDNYGNFVDLATSDITGGGDDEILITTDEEDTNGIFIIYITKALTESFDNKCKIEVERELASGTIQTILKKDIYLNNEGLDWTTK